MPTPTPIKLTSARRPLVDLAAQLDRLVASCRKLLGDEDLATTDRDAALRVYRHLAAARAISDEHMGGALSVALVPAVSRQAPAPPPSPRPTCNRSSEGGCRGSVRARSCDRPGCTYVMERCDGHGGKRSAIAGLAGHVAKAHATKAGARARARKQKRSTTPKRHVGASSTDPACSRAREGGCSGSVTVARCSDCPATFGRCQKHDGADGARGSVAGHQRKMGHHSRAGGGVVVGGTRVSEPEEVTAPAPARPVVERALTGGASL